MAQNNTPRRRRAFADFKENQYDDSFSLSPKQKRKIAVLESLKWAAIIIIAAVFIALGFIITDSLMDISEQPYQDNNTYSASFSKTTQTTAESETSADSQADGGDTTDENSQTDIGDNGEEAADDNGTGEQSETPDDTLEQ
ncbi:MAG: hypothetical protein ACI4XH_09585 [Acutalibacteraceae bacterium]